MSQGTDSIIRRVSVEGDFASFSAYEVKTVGGDPVSQLQPRVVARLKADLQRSRKPPSVTPTGSQRGSTSSTKSTRSGVKPTQHQGAPLKLGESSVVNEKDGTVYVSVGGKTVPINDLDEPLSIEEKMLGTRMQRYRGPTHAYSCRLMDARGADDEEGYGPFRHEYLTTVSSSSDDDSEEEERAKRRRMSIQQKQHEASTKRMKKYTVFGKGSDYVGHKAKTSLESAEQKRLRRKRMAHEAAFWCAQTTLRTEVFQPTEGPGMAESRAKESAMIPLRPEFGFNVAAKASEASSTKVVGKDEKGPPKPSHPALAPQSPRGPQGRDQQRAVVVQKQSQSYTLQYQRMQVLQLRADALEKGSFINIILDLREGRPIQILRRPVEEAAKESADSIRIACICSRVRRGVSAARKEASEKEDPSERLSVPQRLLAPYRHGAAMGKMRDLLGDAEAMLLPEPAEDEAGGKPQRGTGLCGIPVTIGALQSDNEPQMRGIFGMANDPASDESRYPLAPLQELTPQTWSSDSAERVSLVRFRDRVVCVGEAMHQLKDMELAQSNGELKWGPQEVSIPSTTSPKAAISANSSFRSSFSESTLGLPLASQEVNYDVLVLQFMVPMVNQSVALFEQF